MEKICIVKRRREYAQTEVKLILPDNQSDTLPSEVAISSIAINNHPEFSDNQTEVKLILPDNQGDTFPSEVAVSSIAINNHTEFSDNKTEVKIILPDNQSDALPSEIAISSIAINNHTEFSDKKKEVNLLLPDNQSDNLPSEIAISSFAINNHHEFSDKKIVEEFTDKSSSVISITMTKEQSALLQQSEYIKELLSGAKNDPSLDIKLNPDGRISLNYHFNDSLIIRMLSSNQVCQMLQISRSFLRKIINENKLNSYKLGRMRRFLLEDVLEYLSNDVEFTQCNDEQ